MPQAEIAYKEALKIYRQLEENNSNLFLPSVATALNNLTIFYFEEPKIAEKYLLECLQIRYKLAKESPQTQGLGLARTLFVAGFLYESLQDSVKSRAAFSEALTIAQKYPEVLFAQQIIKTAKEKLQK